MHSENHESGTLYVVATPIGNRDDLSQRARQILAEVDLIAAEDTRHTGRLLSHFGIKSRLLSLHEHNEEVACEEVIVQLKSGKSVALVSDAGTPLISDPGYRLVQLAHAGNIRVSPVPGASALIAALSISGLPTDRVCFEGFLPARASARQKRLQALRGETRTLVFYESVHRIAALLADLSATFGTDRPACIARELTKLHEQCVAADLGEIAALLENGGIPSKGEFVVIVGGAAQAARQCVDIDIDALLAGLLEVMPGKQAAAFAAQLTGRKRNALYERMLELRAADNG